MPRVHVSLLGFEEGSAESVLEEVRDARADGVHLDVMDGDFVEGTGLEMGFVNRIAAAKGGLYAECHLMVRRPADFIRQMDLREIDRVIVHNESEDVGSALREVWGRSGVGVAINLWEEVEAVEFRKYGGAEDLKVLVMGVVPGRGGQEIDRGIRDRVELCRRVATESIGRFVLGVDGGINAETRGLVRGADELVIGSAFFKSNDRRELVRLMKEEGGREKGME
jgi:ribulose-phosphate 3-epimerase